MAVTGKIEGLVPEVLARLEAISQRLDLDVEVTSGKRPGPADKSAHNSGIAVDCKISGKKTVEMADELLTEGFSAVGEYYKKDGSAWSFAHGDIRGLPGSENSGPYAPGGSKSEKTCWTGVGDNGSEWTYTWGSRKSGKKCPGK